MSRMVDRLAAGLKNVEWDIWQTTDGKYEDSSVNRAILLDIREELQRLRKVLECSNALAIPELLRAIKRNTTKPRRKKR